MFSNKIIDRVSDQLHAERVYRDELKKAGLEDEVPEKAHKLRLKLILEASASLCKADKPQPLEIE